MANITRATIKPPRTRIPKFMRNAPEHRVFHHGDDDLAACAAFDLHVLEQAGFDQRLQAVIDLRLIQPSAGTRLEIGADCLEFDPPVALDLNRGHGLGGGRRRHKHGGQCGRDRHGEHHQGDHQAPPNSHSKIHSQRALAIPAPGRTPTNRQIPINCPACSQFCRAGKRPIAVRFQFHSKTLPIGHARQTRHYDAARCRMSL
jgi:hypothetical protein